MTEIYKRSQGKYTRVLSFVGVMAIVVIGAYVLGESLKAWTTRKVGSDYVANYYVAYGVPTVIVLAAAVLMFWFVNRPASADFLIATEGEMKKVSWSSRREISGSTKVVIVTTLIMAGVLFGVDFMLAELFKWLGIMG